MHAQSNPEAAGPAAERGGAPGGDAGTGPAAGARYEADGPQGVVRLWLGDRPARHAVDAALRLGRGAPVLDAIEAWLGWPLDWRWCPAAGDADPGVAPGDADPGAGPGTQAQATLVLDDVGGEDTRRALAARLVIDWRLLRSAGAPPAGLGARLRWRPVAAVLELALPPLDPQDWAALEPGGVLLLPDSMRPGWQGRLRAAGEPAGAGTRVALGGDGRAAIAGAAPVALRDPVSAAGAAHARDAVDAVVAGDAVEAGAEARLETALATLPVALVAGWDAGAALPAVGGLQLRCRAARGDAAALPGDDASGVLIPWGDGQAFLVERMTQRQIP